MQICTLLTIRPPSENQADRSSLSKSQTYVCSVLFYNFLILKVSFLSCIFLAKYMYIIHSIVKHLKVLALTPYTPPLLHHLHHHHKRKIHHHEKENSTGHSTKQNRKITKYYWYKREQKTDYCQKPHFFSFFGI